MKSPNHHHRFSSMALPMALLLGACGGETQMPPQAPVSTQTEPMGMTNMQKPVAPPNTATASNVSISEDILRACDIPDMDAYFVFDSAQLTAFDHAPLDALATCFTHGPMAGHKLQLIGHADPRGTPDYNMTLGQSRADAVAGYLRDKGLDTGRMTETSRGALDATGHEETGWAHDRRVEVIRGD